MLIVVCGPPCSGKSSYIRTHARAGDIIIDYDALAQALGSPVSHSHPTHIRTVTLAARRAALFAAIEAHHHGATVWVVDANPGERRLAQFHAAAARIVTMPYADIAELHQRAHAQGRPRFAPRAHRHLHPTPRRGVGGHARSGTARRLVSTKPRWAPRSRRASDPTRRADAVQSQLRQATP